MRAGAHPSMRATAWMVTTCFKPTGGMRLDLRGRIGHFVVRTLQHGVLGKYSRVESQGTRPRRRRAGARRAPELLSHCDSIGSGQAEVCAWHGQGSSTHVDGIVNSRLRLTHARDPYTAQRQLVAAVPRNVHSVRDRGGRYHVARWKRDLPDETNIALNVHGH